MSDFTVISNEDAELFRKLKQFYSEVIDLTLNHDVVGKEEEEIDGLYLIADSQAVVYPAKLGQALHKVDLEWWKNEKGTK
jgi:hypothetical protein